MTGKQENSIQDRGELSHLDPQGRAVMIDVGAKAATAREAVAEGWVHVGEELANVLLKQGGLKKGNVLETARLAGIMAAKRTSELIPLCHPLGLDAVELEAQLLSDRIRLQARVRSEGKTGVEMEAMTAVSVAALTIYDMVKAACRDIEIGPIRLLNKSGGKSGQWQRSENTNG